MILTVDKIINDRAGSCLDCHFILVFIYTTLPIPMGVRCWVYPGKFIGIIVFIVLTPIILLLIPMLIMYTRHEFQLEIIMVGVTW